MKNRQVRTIIALVVLAAAVLFIAGCDMLEESVSIEERIQQLESDLNNNYSRVYTNWHPDDSTTGQAAANPAALQTAFPSSESGSYRFTNVTTGSGTASATLNSSATYSSRAVSFTLRDDAGVWYILSMNTGSTTLSSVE